MQLTLTTEEANVVIAGLAELPAKLSFNLLQRIVAEMQAAPPAESPPPAPAWPADEPVGMLPEVDPAPVKG